MTHFLEIRNIFDSTLNAHVANMASLNHSLLFGDWVNRHAYIVIETNGLLNMRLVGF
jgi:hypothetical protein